MLRNSFYLIFSLLIMTLVSCTEPPVHERNNDVKVKYSIVEAEEITNRVRAAGRLASRVESKLSFKTGGIIAGIRVREGQPVVSGQLLATLDLSEIRNKVRQARLAMNKARRDYQRAENLYRDSVATLEQYQDAQTALEIAASDLAIAEFNMTHSQIMAPTDGKILKKMAEENEIIGPGQPVFLFASMTNDWVLRVNITDRDMINLDLNDSARIFFDAFPEKYFRSIITEKAEMADPYTGTFEIELRIVEPESKLISGMIGTAYIFPGRVKILPVIPHGALLEGAGMRGIVYKVEKGRTIKQRVLIDTILDKGIAIRSGLSEGDTVIIEGGRYIRESSQVILFEDQ